MGNDDNICSTRENYFDMIGQHYLRKKGQTIETWMSDMRNTLVKADEFALCVLAHLINCHVLVNLNFINFI